MSEREYNPTGGGGKRKTVHGDRAGVRSVRPSTSADFHVAFQTCRLVFFVPPAVGRAPRLAAQPLAADPHADHGEEEDRASGTREGRGEHLRGRLADDDERGHEEDEPGEALPQRGRGEARAEAGPQERAEDRGGGHHAEDGPVQAHVGGVAEEAGRGLHRDHQERGPDGLDHGEPAEQGERRHDEKAAAGAHQPGDAADRHRRRTDAEEGVGRGAGRVADPPPHHGERRGERDHAESEHQVVPGDPGCGAPGQVGRRHAQAAEEQARPPPYGAAARVGGGGDQAGDGHHEEGAGDPLLLLHADQVDEQREGEEGAPGAQQSDDGAHHERIEAGEKEHPPPHSTDRASAAPRDLGWGSGQAESTPMTTSTATRMLIRLSPAMKPEATGTMVRWASCGLRRRRISATSAPRNIEMALLPGTTSAIPRPEAEGTNVRTRRGAKRSSRASATPRKRPTTIALREEGASAPRPSVKACETPAQTRAEGAGHSSPPRTEGSGKRR